MAISSAPVQQQTGVATSGNTVTVTLSGNPVAGNNLVLLFGAFPAANVVTGVSGGGVNWGAKICGDNTQRDCEIWIGLNSSGSGTVITITTASTLSGSGGLANVSEWSGMDISSPVDGTPATNSNASSNTITTPNTTIANAGSIVFVVGRSGHNGAATSGPINSFSPLTSAGNGHNCAYRLPGTTGSFGSGWGFGTAAVANSAIAGFKPAAAGGLFRAPDQTGIGSGGPFFKNPLNSRAEMIARKRKIFIMKAAASCYQRVA